MTSLDFDHPGDSDYARPMLCRAAYREKPFDEIRELQNLETVAIYNEDYNKKSYPACEIIPFFHPPKVRSLMGQSIIDNEPYERDDHPAQKVANGRSPIQKIDLTEKCNGRNGFTEFITSCANLQEFKYRHYNMEIWGESWSGIRPGLLYKALLTQKHSLQVLQLDDADIDDYEEDNEAEWEGGYSHPNEWLGSLKEFLHLRILQVQGCNLFGYGRSIMAPSVSL